MCHHTQLSFKIFVETECPYVAQAGLKLLGSSDLPASASQTADITGVSTTSGSFFFFLVLPGLEVDFQKTLHTCKLNFP